MGYMEYEDTILNPDGTVKKMQNIRVGFTKSGMPQCSVHPGEDWCPHIELFITENDDADIWWDDAKAMNLDGFTVPVPIVPTDDIWTFVQLGEPLQGVHSVPAFWKQTHIGEDREPEDALIFLGLWSEGEGRIVLRSMVWDYFLGSYARMKIECANPRHGFSQQVALDKMLKQYGVQSVEWRRNLFCITDTHSCIPCKKRDDSNSADDDDLIPDDTRPRNWK